MRRARGTRSVGVEIASSHMKATCANLGTKAEVLERLFNRTKVARVLPIFRFKVGEWRACQAEVLARFDVVVWSNGELIVRSSALHEDRLGASRAGIYRSIPNVQGGLALVRAVDAVIASYGRDGQEIGADHQVLIQPLLVEIRRAGVAFSRDPATGGPYFVVNYDETADSAAITSGRSVAPQTYFEHRACPIEAADQGLSPIISLVREVEVLLKCDCLDIEFAEDSTNQLWLLQARPLMLANKIGAKRHRATVTAIAAKIDLAGREHPYLRGNRTVFGIMPDWNPAEMIGIRPHPLAFSLYRELITDAIWAYQRSNYGYRNLRSFPLMLNFRGLPYVDVRVSFNSFVPEDIEDPLADRLVNWYVGRLVDAPVLHDKVEFEIVFSCYTFDLSKRLVRLADAGFDDMSIARLSDSLRRLTNRVITGRGALWRAELARISELERRRPHLEQGRLDSISSIYWILEDCKRYGTLPFAGLARAGFMAIQILESLVEIGLIDDDERSAFMKSIDTVAVELQRDFERLGRRAFLARYGHLRPGTYDIVSPRYDEAANLYFPEQASRTISADVPRPFAPSPKTLRELDALLKSHGIKESATNFLEFLKAGIKGREHAKFVFTRSLSDALSQLAALGAQYGMSRDDMSYVDISVIRELYVNSDDIAHTLQRSSKLGRIRYAETSTIALPPLITHPNDAWAFRMPATVPNFVTQSRVSGFVATETSAALTGAIIVLPNADPGFDWLFAHGIAGLITAYGGINSHMAIRAMELGLPAALGVGEIEFTRLRSAHMIELDCANRQIRILS